VELAFRQGPPMTIPTIRWLASLLFLAPVWAFAQGVYYPDATCTEDSTR